MGLFPFFNRYFKPGQSDFGGNPTTGPSPQNMPGMQLDFQGMPRANYGQGLNSAGESGSSNSYNNMLRDLRNANAIKRGPGAVKEMFGFEQGNAPIPKQGFGSKIANYAAQFKPMSKGGSSIAKLFTEGGKMNSMLSGGKMAGIGAAPAWAIPAAAAAAWQVNKRLGQKAHQKDLRKFEDQVRNMSTQQQYEMGLQKPQHSRNGGMLGRLFRR